MIDEISTDGRGWARFSDDRRYRYCLARLLVPEASTIKFASTVIDAKTLGNLRGRVVFLMLNPSTADAFKLDPTVRRCCEFARNWGADVLEVVNLFALRSPHPADLKAATHRGDDAENDAAIAAACAGAQRVIAAWGTHGHLADRADRVASTLLIAGVKLEILGTTNAGIPKHPLARGKHRIPSDATPRAWP